MYIYICVCVCVCIDKYNNEYKYIYIYILVLEILNIFFTAKNIKTFTELNMLDQVILNISSNHFFYYFS